MILWNFFPLKPGHVAKSKNITFAGKEDVSTLILLWEKLRFALQETFNPTEMEVYDKGLAYSESLPVTHIPLIVWR